MKCGSWDFPMQDCMKSHHGGSRAFWCNAPAHGQYSFLQSAIYYHGLQLQREVGEMLPFLCSSRESIMAQVFGCQDFLAWAYRPNRTPATISAGTDAEFLQRFMLYIKSCPVIAGVGLVHFAPNSKQDYDWGNQTQVNSTCYDWLNFPNHLQYSQRELLRMGQRRRWRIPAMVVELSAEGERHQKRDPQQLVVSTLLFPTMCLYKHQRRLLLR